MENWKRNLIVCWFGTFVSIVGISQIAPILPLYLKHLGVQGSGQIEQLSGLAFGVTYITSAIFSPIWGKAADKFGRKPMLLRASLGMAIVLFIMGFAQNVTQLIVLRLLQGVVAGYATACTTLIATQTSREHAGWALGTLSTATVSGSLIGPVIGGLLASTLGLRSNFWSIGILMLIAFITTVIFIKEDFKRVDTHIPGIKEVWRQMPNHGLMITVFITTFVSSLALTSIQPIITVYIMQLSQTTTHVALISGLTFSASGFASIIAAPRLGKLSDNIGAQKVMLVALIISGLIFVPQAYVNTPWQLMGLRFLLGIATAGLIPAINTLLKLITPDNLIGRVFGYNISAQYLGVFVGTIMSGLLASFFGIKSTFFVIGILFAIDAIWVYKMLYPKLRRISLK